MKKCNALILSLLLSTQVLASNSSLIKKSFKNFKSGSYAKVVSALESSRGDNEFEETRHYLLAMSYNRLQKFDKSIRHFKKAIKSGSSAIDVYYEYGQALYANNELSKARVAFKRSQEKSFKVDSSHYYIAHISQILEENKKAKNYYTKIVKSKTADKNLKQVARFQLAEVLLSMARNVNETERIVKTFVLPQIDEAIKVDTSSKLAHDIKVRKKEIEREFGLDPNLLRNGRSIPKRRWKLSVSEKVSYDNNISLTNNLPASAASLEDSFVFKTALTSRYALVLKKRFLITPALALNSKNHTNKNSETVRSENDYNITPRIGSSFEHTMFKNPASLILDFDYSYKSKYRTELNRKSFYSRYTNFTIGEKFKYFTKGDSTFKMKFKDLSSYTESQNSKTTTFSFDQLYLTTRGNILLFLMQYDLMDTYNNTTTSTNSTLLRVDFINPELLPKISMHVGLSLNLIDYTDQTENDARGLEKTLSPSVKLTKKVTSKIKLSVGYVYTNNTSNKDDYKYSKHVTSTQIKYTF